MSLTERELHEITRINESGRQPVLLVHGLWLLAGSWARWESYLERRGFAPLALDWPGDPASVEEARADPAQLAGTGIQEVATHIEDVTGRLTRRPAVVGHSVGGLLAQMIAGRGASVATVAIDPAPFKGVRGLAGSVVKSSLPVLRNPANRRRAVTLTFDEFVYGFANAVPTEEARALYDEFHVAAPGRPVFQIAFADLSFSGATRVDTKNEDRGPLLIVSGGADHTVPPSVATGAHRKQAKNSAPTQLVELDGAGHSLVIDHRWEEVAGVTVDFLERSLVGTDERQPS